MPAKANSEHVVALALQPIRGPVDVVHAVDLERLILRKLSLDAEKAPVWKRAEVPDHLERNLGVAILDGGDIAQKIIALRRIVVQPTYYLLDRRRIHIHYRLTPDHFDPLDRGREFLLEPCC